MQALIVRITDTLVFLPSGTVGELKAIMKSALYYKEEYV